MSIVVQIWICFSQCCFELVGQLWIHDVLTRVRRQFDIFNRSQCHIHICQDVVQRRSVHIQLILNDVQHSREVLYFSESQVDVLFIEVESGDPVGSRQVQFEVALLAHVPLVATHWIAYSRQTFHHLVYQPIIENEDSRPVLLYGSEVHEGLVISIGVETDGDVFGPVSVDENEASQQDIYVSNIR